MRASSPHFSLYLPLLVTAFAVPIAVAQSTSSAAAAAAQSLSHSATGTGTGKYGTEPYVIQRISNLSKWNADGTGIEERTLVAKIQTDAALRSFGVLNTSFAAVTACRNRLRARPTPRRYTA